MQHYSDNVIRVAGVASQGLPVLILSNGAPATIYSDNGVTQKANPVRTDVNGSFDFYAANGTYTWQLPIIGGTEINVSATLYDPADASASLAASLAASSGASLRQTQG